MLGSAPVLLCPNCGQIAHLGAHEVSEDGEVEPSVDCPYDDCDFHDYVRLEEWEGGDADE